MSEPSCKKGDKTEENIDYNKETILRSITATTSAESMSSLNPEMLNEIVHNDTSSSSNEQLDLELNEIEETRTMLSSSTSPGPDQLVTDTAVSEGKFLLRYGLNQMAPTLIEIIPFMGII